MEGSVNEKEIPSPDKLMDPNLLSISSINVNQSPNASSDSSIEGQLKELVNSYFLFFRVQ